MLPFPLPGADFSAPSGMNPFSATAGFSFSTTSRYSAAMRASYAASFFSLSRALVIGLLLQIARAFLFFARGSSQCPAYQGRVASSVVTISSLSTSDVLDDSIFTFLPPAKISWRPCSSYHLVSVAVMCIFSMMFLQPTPVL